MTDNTPGLQDQLAIVEKEISQINEGIQRLQAKQQKLLTKRDQLKFKLQQESSVKLASLNWDNNEFPWSKELEAKLHTAFHISKLRPFQLSTMNATLSGQDCILIMPTGGGKSLCYQLPALLSKGVTLVVSPLVSLMEDQLMALNALGLPAEMLSASSTRAEVTDVLREMVKAKPRMQILYVTPEKLAKSKRFRANLEKMYQKGNFARLAIDEVHCCSQWGNDFRPDYKFLGVIKRLFAKVPVIGLTATATAQVVTDVQKILNVPGCLVLKASFNRPNLKYKVYPKSSSLKETVDQLEKLIRGNFKNQSGIIYCFSIKESEELASHLRACGIKARPYHAQLAAKLRSSVHKSWASNETQVVVATVAFGMGIDKPNVRFVIHHSMPKSMENFYQESGRAGRDDKLAHCILLYRFADIFRLSTMVYADQTGLENLYAMTAYCIDSKRCRRSIIAQHFGERWEASDCNSMCDHCHTSNKWVTEEKDCTPHCRNLYEILRQATFLEERMTAQKLVDAWVGKGPPKLRVKTVSNLPRATCELIVALLLIEGYLKEDFHFTPYSTISYINTGAKASSVDNGSHRVLLELPAPRTQKLSGNVDTIPTSSITTKTNLNTAPLPVSSSNAKKEQDDRKRPVQDDNSDNELNFDEWNNIPSSKEVKKTVKKQKTEIVEISD